MKARSLRRDSAISEHLYRRAGIRPPIFPRNRANAGREIPNLRVNSELGVLRGLCKKYFLHRALVEFGRAISVSSKAERGPIEDGRRGKLSRETPPIAGGWWEERGDPCSGLEWDGRIRESGEGGGAR